MAAAEYVRLVPAASGSAAAVSMASYGAGIVIVVKRGVPLTPYGFTFQRPLHSSCAAFMLLTPAWRLGAAAVVAHLRRPAPQLREAWPDCAPLAGDVKLRGSRRLTLRQRTAAGAAAASRAS
jgi:hypothetical protein